MSSINLYVGAMNDGVFIIDKPPRPAPTDHVGNHSDVHVVAKMVDSDAAAINLARKFAASDDLLVALKAYMHAMEGFAEAVRSVTGTAYPWEAQDIERAKALIAIQKAEGSS